MMHDAADPCEQAGALRRGDQAHELQSAQLAVRRRLDTEALGRLLQVSGAPFGEGERCVGHPAQLQPLLGASGSDRALKMGTRGLGVITLRGASTEDRLGRGLELGLGLELLVRAALELLHRRKLAALLDPHHPLLLWHPKWSLVARQRRGLMTSTRWAVRYFPASEELGGGGRKTSM